MKTNLSSELVKLKLNCTLTTAKITLDLSASKRTSETHMINAYLTLPSRRYVQCQLLTWCEAAPVIQSFDD